MQIQYTKRIEKKITPKVDAKIREVLSYFPELSDIELTVGAIESSKYGTAEIGGNKINLRVGRVHPLKQTIAHELVHLLQCRDGLDIPQGERSCDLWVCARSPDLLDDKPNYLEIPVSKKDLECGFTRNIIHITAKKALKQRACGNRRYIKWFEDEIKNIFKS